MSKQIEQSEAENERSSSQMLSFSKMLAVLDCFSRDDRSLSVLEIARRTKLPRTTVHRIVGSLRSLGLIDQDRDREKYRLGLKLFELGNTVLANMDVQREASESIATLVNKTGQSVHLGVFDGFEIVMVERADSKVGQVNRVVTLESAAAYCSATGKAALAFQPQSVVDRIISHGFTALTPNTITSGKQLMDDLAAIRERGYSIDDAEYEDWRRCVAAPIRNASGRVFAAISVTGKKENFTDKTIPEYASLVVAQADKISRRLGYERNGE
ncbi:IclR family transcriptional regulator [Rhizobium sp. SSA_523]|uniref:IclR family transcriptional regulator n=1 Tax=Rhizobium sp. SSA_523 TaxID=2952477 RepID=UPI00209112C1|nr:IclR family transcriptional regulator [Rhizobium sp. SSA_523]MCO5733370.1 IclR family transcriptional regulator [Rhizobium sp. SSA_523]WKC21654.1 IclR family transcriptional regulator [Rhizobium sp. SSA_523]